MKANNNWFLAKYEPASNVGSYSWDYKFDNDIEGTNLVNRYLIESTKLFLFLYSSNYYFYIVTPIKGHSKIQKLVRKKKLQENEFKALSYSYIENEKKYIPPVSEDIRTINYYYKCLIKYGDDQFNLDILEEERDAVILFSKEAISENILVDYMKKEEMQLWRNKDGMLKLLGEANIGLVYKHHYFFHEESSFQPQQEEGIFICYAPWKLT